MIFGLEPRGSKKLEMSMLDLAMLTLAAASFAAAAAYITLCDNL